MPKLISILSVPVLAWLAAWTLIRRPRWRIGAFLAATAAWAAIALWRLEHRDWDAIAWIALLAIEAWIGSFAFAILGLLAEKRRRDAGIAAAVLLFPFAVYLARVVIPDRIFRAKMDLYLTATRVEPGFSIDDGVRRCREILRKEQDMAQSCIIANSAQVIEAQAGLAGCETAMEQARPILESLDRKHSRESVKRAYLRCLRKAGLPSAPRRERDRICSQYPEFEERCRIEGGLFRSFTTTAQCKSMFGSDLDLRAFCEGYVQGRTSPVRAVEYCFRGAPREPAKWKRPARFVPCIQGVALGSGSRAVCDELFYSDDVSRCLEGVRFGAPRLRE